jgi:SSS family solute:Na+ symporter
MMVLSLVDWLIVVVYMIFVLWIGIRMTQRASGSMEDFFISGRHLPWWLIGTSMVASAFASDTPLFMTNLVRTYGISGTWYATNASVNGLLSAFLFAPLWRRSLAITDAEFREMRYSGTSGKVVRSVWAIYQGILCNCITMGWVILAVVKLGRVALGLPPEITLFGLSVSSSVVITVVILIIVLVYSTLSGLWGIVTIDFFQYFVAFFGTVMLAILSVQKVGGISALSQGITTSAEAGPDFLNIMPSFGSISMTFFIVGLTIQWWASPWTDGGIYVAQRILAARDERNAVIGRFWSNLAQYGIIIWPWIIVALCSLLLYPASQYPEIARDPESAYPKMMVTVLPPVFRGIMVAAFLAAFMSTFDTLINNTSSYMVNDLYKRFLVRNKPPKHYVLMARICMLLSALIAGFIAVISDNILRLSMLVFEIAAGVGMIFILRWLWWRINAWSEISSYFAGIIGAILVNIKFGHMILMRITLLFTPEGKTEAVQNFFTNTIGTMSGFPFRMTFLALFSTIISLIVTFLTKPDEMEHLAKFYIKVKPPGAGWRRIQKITKPFNLESNQVHFKWSNLLIGAIFFYSAFFSFGKLPLGHYRSGLVGLAIAVVSGIYLWRKLNAYKSEN